MPLACPELSQIVCQLHLESEVNHNVGFLRVVMDPKKFNCFKGVWSGMPKVVESNELTISQK